PGVELPLVTFRVGIEARVVAALRGLHLAQRPVGDRAGHARVRWIAGGERRLRIHGEQRAVVVQHLLEVRDRPVLVDRVAAESAAQLVVDTALGHAAQRERRHVPGLEVRLGRAGARLPAPKQPLDGLRVRELRCAAETPVAGIEAARELLAQARERGLREVAVGTLLAVDFDVDEVLVEKARGGLVFEALFPQSVAPMTRVVSYTQVNRLFFGACPLERFAAPRVPLDWIVCMLPQVWARLSREMVRVLRRAVAVEVADFHPDLQSRLYTRPCPSSVPDSCRTPLPPTSSPLRASCASS